MTITTAKEINTQKRKLCESLRNLCEPLCKYFRKNTLNLHLNTSFNRNKCQNLKNPIPKT